ncbi:MAG TPA: hypothetical protein VGB11_03120 [Candidatus Bathyarchaeia archaeon]
MLDGEIIPNTPKPSKDAPTVNDEEGLEVGVGVGVDVGVRETAGKGFSP